MTNVVQALANEFDWPQNSWATGYEGLLEFLIESCRIYAWKKCIPFHETKKSL
jgi:hypothetical protein